MSQRWITPALTLVLLSASSAVHSSERLLQPTAPNSRQGLPGPAQRPLCPALQRAVEGSLGSSTAPWSISVLDERGQLLADINGWLPRIPASNQKLISSAFALDRLGPDFRLKTQLLRHGDGSLEIVGEGDPDLSIAEIQRFAMVALGRGGSRSSDSAVTPLQLMVREEPPQRWWPSDWPSDDRSYAYGAPITRLALTSNALHMAVMDPARRLERVLSTTVSQQGGSLRLVRVNPEQREAALSRSKAEAPVVIHSELSAPMHGLLSLANTESHNFTAEVLMREAADNWDVAEASMANTRWLQAQGIPIQGLRIRDGSGLSRGNRVTSRTLSTLLWRMAQHPYGAFYQASMAIAGRRGTLWRFQRGTPLTGQFWGKTGTLRGVSSLSGILKTSNGPRYVSMIANGAPAPRGVMGDVLLAVQRISRCPSWNAVGMRPDVHG